MGMLDIFGGNSTYKPDIGPQLGNIDASTQRQQGLASSLLSKLQAGQQPYQDKMTAATSGGLDASRASAGKFLSDIGSSSDKLGENLSQSLLRRLTQGNQATTNSLRENLAATGGLQRGGADAAFADNSRTLSNNLFEGNNNIVQNQLAARQDALKQAQSVDQNVLANKLGIDTNTLASIYGSGRQDLIDETNSLLGIDKSREDAVGNALQFQQNSNLALNNANNNASSGLASSLLGAAGTLGGMALAGPAGGMIGGTVASAAGGQGNPNTSNPSFLLNQLLMRNSTLGNSSSSRGTVNNVG